MLFRSFLYIIKFLFLSACDSCKVVIPETVFLQEKNEQLKQEKYKISLSLENAKNQINNLEKHKYLASNNQQNNLFLREKNNFTKELEIKEEEINNHKQELQAKEKIINNLNKSISLFEIDNNNIINDIETLKELISKNRKDIDLVINKLLNNNFFKRFITNNSYHDIISDIIADKEIGRAHV